MTDTRQQVLDEVRPLADLFSDAGFSLYLVGGIVRDLSLGALLTELDFDFTTNARPRDIRRVVAPVAEAIWTQGERFGTIGCLIGDRHYEITTHRAEWYSTDSRKPDVLFGQDVEVDLSRRDFTVNAMALRLPDGQHIDPFDGLGALENRSLVTPIDAHVSFADDPLRILRAARFIARYDLVSDDGVTMAAKELVDRLEIVSAERIRDELDKVLAADRPGAGMRFLEEIEAFPHVFHWLAPDALSVVGEILDRSANEMMLRRLVLFSRCDENDRTAQLRALRYSNDDTRTMLAVLRGIDLVSEATGDWSDADVRLLVDSVGYDHMTLLFSLLGALDTPGGPEVTIAFDALDAVENLASFTPVLSGQQVMAELDLAEGPEVGRALSALRQRRLHDGPATAEEELTFLRTLDER